MTIRYTGIEANSRGHLQLGNACIIPYMGKDQVTCLERNQCDLFGRTLGGTIGVIFTFRSTAGPTYHKGGRSLASTH